MQTVPIPHPVFPGSSALQNTAQKPSRKAGLLDNLDAAREAMNRKKAQWATLSLRQTFADESFMRDHIKAAGLRCPNAAEPATVLRLRRFLARANVRGPEINASVGASLRGFLALNPLLPLWAALALVLESTGKFTQKAAAIARAAGSL